MGTLTQIVVRPLRVKKSVGDARAGLLMTTNKNFSDQKYVLEGAFDCQPVEDCSLTVESLFQYIFLVRERLIHPHIFSSCKKTNYKTNEII